MSPHWNWLSFIALELYHFKCLCDSRFTPLTPNPSERCTASLSYDRKGLSAQKKRGKFNVKAPLLFRGRIKLRVLSAFARQGVCARRARRLDRVCFSCSMCKRKVLRVLVTLCIKAQQLSGLHVLINPCLAPEERA